MLARTIGSSLNPATRAAFRFASQPALRRVYTPGTTATFSNSAPTMSVKAISSYDEFKTLINGDKAVIVDFTASWCGPCKVISPIFEKFASEAPADKVAFYKVDVDDQEQVAQEAGVSAMPTFIVFKNGEKIDSIVGAVPQKLQALVQKYSA